MNNPSLLSDEDVLTSRRRTRYLYRILVLYVCSVIFKSFDLSFADSAFELSFRGQLFSVCFVLFGLLVWEGAAALVRQTRRRRESGRIPHLLFPLLLLLLPYGLCCAFIFGFFYAVADLFLFNRYEAWQSFSELSYDLNFGIFIFYLMLLGFNGIIYYYRVTREYQIRTERLMRENIQARYDALSNQIDPHFFFNSLSVLTNLVYKDQDLAAEYIVQLAKTYRFILDTRFETAVTIQTELEFLDSYLFLIRIRHRDHISCTTDIPGKLCLQGMILPATLQLLIENAIKHNRFSAAKPLQIHIFEDEGCLLVRNTLWEKQDSEHSLGIGLKNIRKRYELATGELVEISRTADFFTVKLPIIRAT